MRSNPVLVIAILACVLASVIALAAPSTARAETAYRSSTTLDTAGPLVIGALLRTYSEFLEHQVAVADHVSVIGEISYLGSSNFKELGGDRTGLEVKLGILCFGASYWPRRPFSGPFVSVRGEVWLASAQNAEGNAAVGHQFDANFQPGWQWTFGHATVIAGLSFAFVTGPIKSPDGSVEFPLHGFSGTPHLRLGYVW